MATQWQGGGNKAVATRQWQSSGKVVARRWQLQRCGMAALAGLMFLLLALPQTGALVAAELHFGAPVSLSDGQVNSSNQMAHGCDRFFNLDAAGTAIFGGGQHHIFFSTDGARSFKRGYAEGAGYPTPRHGALFPAGPMSNRDFGSIYTETKTNATSFNFSSVEFTNYSLVAGNVTATTFRVPEGKSLSFEGLPHGIRCESFACSLRLQGTKRVTLPDKSELQTAIVWWGGNPKFPQATSIVVFRSVDGGWRWDFRGIVANASQYPDSQEGPNEHSAALLADGKTVMVLMRMDGGDGMPPAGNHSFKAYSRTVSTSGGRTWSLATPVEGLGCARPRLHMMGPHGPLLASGGRGKPGLTEGTPGYPNDVKLWVSADGMGESWVTHSISSLHNRLMPPGTDPEIMYDNGTNYTIGMNRRETTAYTALLPAGSDNEAVVIYGLLRYWTVECNRSSGVVTHCYNRSLHGSEIRANYGFAMRITRQTLNSDISQSNDSDFSQSNDMGPSQLKSDDDSEAKPRWLIKSPTIAQHHVPHVPQWLSMFNPDFDAAGQHSFANLGMSGNIDELLSASKKYGMHGFLSIIEMGSGIWTIPPSGHYNQNETGLQDGWQQNLTAVLTIAEPHLRSGVLAGIFLGDERCCSGIPFKNVTAVADVVRRFLNRTAPRALVYIDECSTPFDQCQKVNPSISCWGEKGEFDSIDIVSLDLYHHADSAPPYHDPATEVNTTKAFVAAHLVPKLNERQRLIVVPGTFADWNVSRSGPVEQQEGGVIAKLNGYWSWAQSEPLIIGINCFHWLTIPGLYKRAPGIIPYYWGVDSMPKVVARLVEIGDIIRNHSAALSQ